MKDPLAEELFRGNVKAGDARARSTATHDGKLSFHVGRAAGKHGQRERLASAARIAALGLSAAIIAPTTNIMPADARPRTPSSDVRP